MFRVVATLSRVVCQRTDLVGVHVRAAAKAHFRLLKFHHEFASRGLAFGRDLVKGFGEAKGQKSVEIAANVRGATLAACGLFLVAYVGFLRSDTFLILAPTHISSKESAGSVSRTLYVVMS